MKNIFSRAYGSGGCFSRGGDYNEAVCRRSGIDNFILRRRGVPCGGGNMRGRGVYKKQKK